MATENQNIYRQVYNVHEDVHLLAAVHRVTCVFLRRAVLSAAFNANDELLSVHYIGYSKDKQVWDLDFFEPLFTHEPLLLKVEKITKVFFFSADNLVVPEALYNREEAELWLKNIQFIAVTDEIQHYYLKEDKAWYLYGVPLNIKALVKINCPTVSIKPLPAYQFSGNYTRGVRLHCFVSSDQACVSLYHYGALLWHRIFDYTAAEDIAYEIRVVCEEHKINADKITIACTGLSASEHGVVNALSQYFASVTTAAGHTINNVWTPALSLIKELESCA